MSYAIIYKKYKNSKIKQTVDSNCNFSYNSVKIPIVTLVVTLVVMPVVMPVVISVIISVVIPIVISMLSLHLMVECYWKNYKY